MARRVMKAALPPARKASSKNSDEFGRRPDDLLLLRVPKNCPKGNLRKRREASADLRTNDSQHSPPRGWRGFKNPDKEKGGKADL
jgi:hypothetical protein